MAAMLPVLVKCGHSQSSSQHFIVSELACWFPVFPEVAGTFAQKIPGNKEGSLYFLTPQMLGTQSACKIELELKNPSNSKVL